MFLLHFPTGRQISHPDGLIFYALAFSRGTKACVTAADLIDLDEILHCFMRPLSRCNIKISVVSQCRCRNLVAVLHEHTVFCVFLPPDNLLLLDCAVTWSPARVTAATVKALPLPPSGSLPLSLSPSPFLRLPPPPSLPLPPSVPP